VGSRIILRELVLRRICKDCSRTDSVARNGNRVLCVDADRQGFMPVSLGVMKPDKLTVTLATALTHIYNDENFSPQDGVVKTRRT
jgi:CO dehydrogenase nickel-insertion accessory protein CooC1